MICTFYSYKGGVGRSMALANCADILARRGLRVLMIDFDLEAPGLEQYFPIPQERVLCQPGLLDLLLSYKRAMSGSGAEEEGEPAFKRLQELFIVPVYAQLPSRGRLDLLHAGQRGDAQQLARYALDLRGFDWQDFYLNWEGEAFFEWLRGALVPGLYDVVLVDSRTGVTEMGGICAYQLADAIVMFCAANKQNLEGTRSVVSDFFSPRVTARRRHRSLQVLVVPARIEPRDPALLNNFRETFDETFSPFTPESLRREGLSFWDLLIPYTPLYAFEERVVVRPGSAWQGDEIAGSFQTLVRAITCLAEPEEALSKAGPEKRGGLSLGVSVASYDITRRHSGYDAVLSYTEDDRRSVELIAEKLRKQGFSVALAPDQEIRGSDGKDLIGEFLHDSRSFLLLSGPSSSTRGKRRLLSTLQRAQKEHLPVGFIELPNSPPVEDLALTLPTSTFRVRLKSEDSSYLRVADFLSSVRSRGASEVVLQEGPPYLGLRPYDEKDALLFFGREALIAEILHRLPSMRLLALVGVSGAGKTSLVRAGVIPALRRGEIAGSESWSVVMLRPGVHPVKALAAALKPLLPALAPEQLATPEAFAKVVQEIAGEHRLLLFIDQLEEIFTSGDRSDSSQEGKDFIDLISNVLESGAPLSVLLALRADFYQKSLSLPALSHWLESRVVNIGAMSADELREVIEAPARRAGLAFEPGLVERLIEDALPLQAPPLLQFLLFQLWQRRRDGWLTNAAFEEMGGFRGALAYRAEEAYSTLPDEEKKAARRILLALTRIEEGSETTRRRAEWADLVASGPEGRAAERAIAALTKAGLLTAGEADGQRTIELAHEALIRNWPRAQKWIEEDRRFLLWRQQINPLLRHWSEEGRDPNDLLRGTFLAEALRWLEARKADLTTEERRFIGTSERRRVRARRWITAGAACISLLFLAGAVWAALQWRVSLGRSLTLQAYSQSKDNPDLALLLAAEATRIAENPETQRGLAAVLQQSPQILKVVSTGQNRIQRSAIQPNGPSALLVTQDDRYLLWNSKTGRSQTLFNSSGSTVFAFSPDGTTLATVREAGVQLWDSTTGRAVAEFPVPGFPATAVAFSPRGDRLAIALKRGRVVLCNRAGECTREVSLGVSGAVLALAFNSDGSTLAVGSNDGLDLWDLNTGKVRRGPEDALVGAVAWSPDNRLMAVGSWDGPATIWAIQERKRIWPGEVFGVNEFAFSRDGKNVAAAGVNGEIALWPTQLPALPFGGPFTGAALRLRGHKGPVASISFHDSTLWSVGSDGKLIIWAVAPHFALAGAFPTEEKATSSLSFSPDGRSLAFGGPTGKLWLWATSGRTIRPVPSRNSSGIARIAFTHDGQLMAAARDDGTISLWSGGRELGSLQSRPEPNGLAFSRRGEILYSSNGMDSEVRLWDLGRGIPSSPTILHAAGKVRSLALHPDGGLLAVSLNDRRIELWEPKNLRTVGFLNGSGPSSSLAFSPDGKILAAGLADGSVQFWNLAAGRPLGPAQGAHSGNVSVLAFSPSGDFLASGSSDGALCLWDAHSFQLIGTFTVPPGLGIMDLAFSPNGRVIATAGSAGLLLWPAELSFWRDQACRIANRNLTRDEWRQYVGAEPYRKTCPDLP